MKFVHNLFFKDEYAFAANMMRYAFGLYFLLVGIKKLRVDGALSPVDGYFGFADAVSGGAMNTTILASEMPMFVLYGYGLVLPIAELVAGVFLLINKQVRLAYVIIGLIYLTFVFGQMYSGNTGKIGTDYMPSLVALCVAVYAYEKTRK